MIYFLTGNKGKFEEAKAIIPGLKQLAIDLPEIQDIDPQKIIKYKLQAALKYQKGEFVVEDTFLSLDCLNGLPGPLIKWFLKTIGNKGLYEIAKKFKNYKTEARVTLGFVDKSGKIKIFEGATKGKIVSPRGKWGIGWDPIFLPVGHNKTFAQMTQKEKNKISMRKIAFNKLKKFIEGKK